MILKYFMNHNYEMKTQNYDEVSHDIESHNSFFLIISTFLSHIYECRNYDSIICSLRSEKLSLF